MIRQSLYFTEPHRVALQEEPLSPPGSGQVMVRTLLSAISAGTEMLLFRGEAPGDMAADAAIAALPGTLAFPLKYGYAAVGRVMGLGPGVSAEWQEKLVFAFHPHENLFVADLGELLPVPPDLAPEEAVFFPNMETACILALDGNPLLGEQVSVFGQGMVGLLLTALLVRLPLASLITLDRFPRRRLASENLGAHASLDPLAPEVLSRLRSLLQGDRPYSGADLTYEISGNPAALDLALAATGFNGRLVIGSWYGTKKSELHLGGPFHRQRQLLKSSQVSTIPPELSGRWNKPRLAATTWQMLREIRPARFITHRFPLAQAAQAYQVLDQKPEEAIQVILTY